MAVTSAMTLEKTVTAILLADSVNSLLCWLWWSKLAYSPDMTIGEGKEGSTTQQESETFSPTYKELNPVNNEVNLEMNPSPLKTSDETTALADTLITVLGETLKQRTQLSQT